jgi:hypothetical protein
MQMQIGTKDCRVYPEEQGKIKKYDNIKKNKDV